MHILHGWWIHLVGVLTPRCLSLSFKNLEWNQHYNTQLKISVCNYGSLVIFPSFFFNWLYPCCSYAVKIICTSRQSWLLPVQIRWIFPPSSELDVHLDLQKYDLARVIRLLQKYDFARVIGLSWILFLHLSLFFAVTVLRGKYSYPILL